MLHVKLDLEDMLLVECFLKMELNATNIDGGIKTYLNVKRAKESIENQYHKNNKDCFKR